MRDHSNDFEIGDFSRLPAKPVVSVLMATYNHASYLAEAIEGVLAQRSDFPIELLIADDASTDDTAGIALRYQRDHPDIVRIVSGRVNVGARANRRRASRRMRGEFVAFCEGDDCWTDPYKLQRQVDWLRANPGAGAIHTDFDHVLERRGRSYRLYGFQRHRDDAPGMLSGRVFEHLLLGNFMQTCTLCVRAELEREFLDGVLKDSYPVGDWPLCLYIASGHSIGYLPESTAIYRKVPGSMTNSGHGRRARLFIDCVPMLEDFCSAFAVPAAVQKQALSRLYRIAFSLAYLAGDLVTFDRATSWLAEYDFAFLRSWPRQLKIRFARSAVLRRIFVFKHDANLFVHEWSRYRSIGRMDRRRTDGGG